MSCCLWSFYRNCVRACVHFFLVVVGFLVSWSMRIHGSGEIIWLPWRSIQIFQFLETRKNKKKQWAAISTCCPALRVVPREDAVRRWLRSDLPGIRRLTNDAHQAAQWTQSGYRIEGGDLRSPASGQCLSTEHRRRRKSIFKPRLITHYEKLQSLMFSVAYQNQFFQIINKKKK